MPEERHHWLERQMLMTTRGRYALLVALVVDIFVLPPLTAVGALPQPVLGASFSVTMIAAIFALAGRARGLVIAVASLAFAVRWAHVISTSSGIEILSASFGAVASGTFAALLLADAFRKGELPGRLLAVLLAYLLLGATWANLYWAVDLIHPGALSLPGTRHPVAEFVYFSFATLTTAGYGDILPVHPVARSLAVLEALTGQLYLVLVVARFVGERSTGPRAEGGA